MEEILLALFKIIATATVGKGTTLTLDKLWGHLTRNDLQKCFDNSINSYCKENNISSKEQRDIIENECAVLQCNLTNIPEEAKGVYELFIKNVSKKQPLANQLGLIISTQQLEISKNQEALAKENKQLLELLTNFLKSGALTSGLPAEIRKSSDIFEINKKQNSHIIYRGRVVEELLSMLKACKLVLIYGGKMSGKTTIATQLYDLAKKGGDKAVYINVEYSRSINIIEQIEQIEQKESDRQLFIIDNIDTRATNEYAQSLLCYIISKKGNNQYFIAGTDKLDLAQVKYETEGIFEYSVPDFNDDEIRQVASSYEMPHDFSLFDMLKSHGTHPLIIQYVCAFCKLNCWDVSEKTLNSLISYKGQDVQYKISQFIDKDITDELTKELLARMSLFGKIITDSQLSVLANVEVPISGYRDKINKIIPTWVNQKNGVYYLSDIFRFWDYGLPMTVKKSCYRSVANDILKCKELDPIQVTNVILYFAIAEEYHSAAQILIWAIDVYNKQKKALNNPLFTNFWLDIPLPSQMSLKDRFLIRFMQYQYLDLIQEKKRFIALDVYDMVKLPTVDVTLKSVIFPFLIMAFTQLNELDKSLECFKENAKLILPVGVETQTLLKLREEINMHDSQYYQLLLYQSDDINKFRVWVELGSETPSLESCQIFVDHICQKLTGPKPDWYAVYAHLDDYRVAAEKGEHNENLVVIIVTTLMRIKGKILHDISDARLLFNKYTTKYKTQAALKYFYEEFGYICYVNELYEESLECLDSADKFQNDDVPSIVLIRIHLIKSFLLAKKNAIDALDEAVNMFPYLENSDIDELTRANYLGEVAIAYWSVGDESKAIYYINQAMSFAWKVYEENIDDEVAKFTIRKVGACLSESEQNHKIKDTDKKNVCLKPGIFTEHFEKVLLDDFTDKLIICITAEMYDVCSKNLYVDESFKWAKIMVSKMQMEHTEFNSYVMALPYLFVYKKEYDYLETLLDIYANNHIISDDQKMNQSNKEATFFYIYLYPLMMKYCIELMERGESNIFCDYIRPMINNHSEIFVDKVKYAELKAIASKKDLPSLSGNECPEILTFKKLWIITQADASVSFFYLMDVLIDISRYSEVRLSCFDKVLNDFSISILKNKMEKYKSELDLMSINERGFTYIEQGVERERYKRAIKVFYNGLKAQPKIEDKYLTWMGY